MRNVTPLVALAALWLLPHAQSPAGAQEISSPVAPQEHTPASNDRGVVVAFSGGAASIGIAAGLSVWANVGSEVDILVRITETSEFTLFSPSDVVNDFAILVGTRRGTGKTWAGAAAGLAWVQSLEHGDGVNCAWFSCDYNETEESTIGLAIQGDAVWAIGRSFGLGLTAFGNLNPSRSFAGLNVGIYLGRQR
jgi:hypothetical protein